MKSSCPRPLLATLAAAFAAVAASCRTPLPSGATGAGAHAGESVAGDDGPPAERGAQTAPATCTWVAGDLGLDFLAAPGGCPPSLATVDGRCGGSTVTQAICGDHIEIDFAPRRLDPSQAQVTSTCFYSAGARDLLGGWITTNPNSESPIANTAGRIPRRCADGACATATARCAADATDASIASID